MKIRPVGAELFDADRRTDMKLIVNFRNFANVSTYLSQASNLSPRYYIFTW
jgi:hypothetical protein